MSKCLHIHATGMLKLVLSTFYDTCHFVTPKAKCHFQRSFDVPSEAKTLLRESTNTQDNLLIRTRTRAMRIVNEHILERRRECTNLKSGNKLSTVDKTAIKFGILICKIPTSTGLLSTKPVTT